MSDYIFDTKNAERDIGNYNYIQKCVYNGSEEENMFLLQREMLRRNNFTKRELTGISLAGFDRTSQFGRYEELLSTQINSIGSSGTKSLKIPKAQQPDYFHSNDSNTPLVFDEKRISPKYFAVARNAIRKVKERSRRETLNRVEKNRRSYINEKIAELGNMLPENIDRSLCKGKGSILKETVEYIKTLQRDQEKTRLLEVKVYELDAEFRKIARRLERIESLPDSNINDCLDQMQIEVTSTEACRHMTQDTNSDINRQWSSSPDSEFTSPKEEHDIEEQWNTPSIDESTHHFPSDMFSDTLCNYF